MFGYIKLDSKAPRIAKTIFKKNYCMLCRAIEKNYGQKSRMLLSYDVTFLFMLFSNESFLSDVKKVRCFSNGENIKNKTNNELLKKCAALNLAMAEAELYDHINDDKSFLAKTLLKIYKRPFKKVQRDYPEMRKKLIDGYAKFDEYEKNNKSLDDIEDMFASLITSIAIEDFQITDEQIIDQLSFVAKWLYFIDACDDLDKDIKTGSFNCLKNFESTQKLFDENYRFIEQHMNKIVGRAKPTESNDVNRQITNRIIFCGIPESTYKVVRRIKEHGIVC